MAEAPAALSDPIAVSPGVSGASVALLVVDNECEVAEASLAACRLLGLGRDDILDRPLPELLAPAAAERLTGVWQAFHDTGGHAGPFELAWPNGAAPIDISVTAAVLPGRHLVLLSPSQGSAPAPPSASGPVPGSRPPTRGPTKRERQILGMLAAGDTDVQVAGKLELSPATVQTHVRNAKAKLGARTRAQAVAMALRHGLIDAD
jgi:DNA-binding CsgD family transcriptional regulator